MQTDSHGVDEKQAFLDEIALQYLQGRISGPFASSRITRQLGVDQEKASRLLRYTCEEIENLNFNVGARG